MKWPTMAPKGNLRNREDSWGLLNAQVSLYIFIAHMNVRDHRWEDAGTWALLTLLRRQLMGLTPSSSHGALPEAQWNTLSNASSFNPFHFWLEGLELLEGGQAVQRFSTHQPCDLTAVKCDLSQHWLNAGAGQKTLHHSFPGWYPTEEACFCRESDLLGHAMQLNAPCRHPSQKNTCSALIEHAMVWTFVYPWNSYADVLTSNVMS